MPIYGSSLYVQHYVLLCHVYYDIKAVCQCFLSVDCIGGCMSVLCFCSVVSLCVLPPKFLYVSVHLLLMCVYKLFIDVCKRKPSQLFPPDLCGWARICCSSSIWKSHCHLSQILYCSSCCRWWHNQLLDLGGNYFFTQIQIDLDHIYSLNIWNPFFKIALCDINYASS